MWLRRRCCRSTPYTASLLLTSQPTPDIGSAVVCCCSAFPSVRKNSSSIHNVLECALESFHRSLSSRCNSRCRMSNREVRNNPGIYSPFRLLQPHFACFVHWRTCQNIVHNSPHNVAHCCSQSKQRQLVGASVHAQGHQSGVQTK
jgi:hypothetical protein